MKDLQYEVVEEESQPAEEEAECALKTEKEKESGVRTTGHREHPISTSRI